jgi:hypothetical protein
MLLKIVIKSELLDENSPVQDFITRTLTAGPELPSDLGAGPCALALDTGLIFIMGGSNDGYETTYYNPVTEAFSSGPNMINDHESFACVHFYSDKHNGRPVVLSKCARTCTKI